MKRLCTLLLALVMSISFVVPAMAASLSNFTKQNTYTQGQFTDVNPSAWYEEYIQEAYEYGLIVGYSSTSMGPERNMTIAEAIVLATRLHSTYYANDYIYSSEYPLPGGAWYDVYIRYAINNHIISYGDFSDYTINVTRAQFADIIESAFPDSELKQINTVPDDSIPDVKINDDHAEAIYHLYRAGILGGVDSSGRFNPMASIRRAEVATLIVRIVDPSLRLSSEAALSNPEDELAAVSSLSDLEDYLNKNMASCTTPMGTYTYKFTVRERTEDFIIETAHTGVSPWYELKYSNSISDNIKEETLSILRSFQKEVYRIASTAFPNAAISGGFCDSGYKYPNIHVGAYVITALSWTNHLDSAEDTIHNFYWETSRDWYEFNSEEENTDIETDITTLEGLENYLNTNLNICETPMGTYSLKFDVSQNTYSFNGWDIEILTEGNYSVLPWAEINNSIEYTEQERTETLNILKNIQKEIYTIASEAFPGKKLTGCYFSDWYKYPSLEVGYETSRHLTWTNYASNSYGHDYDSTYITSFHWDNWRDD